MNDREAREGFLLGVALIVALALILIVGMYIDHISRALLP